MADVIEGDCNSKLFHRVANFKCNRNYIKALENEGIILDNIDSVSMEILHFFCETICESPWRILEVRRFRLVTHFGRECF